MGKSKVNTSGSKITVSNVPWEQWEYDFIRIHGKHRRCIFVRVMEDFLMSSSCLQI
jgi:hypothetical protein